MQTLTFSFPPCSLVHNQLLICTFFPFFPLPCVLRYISSAMPGLTLREAQQNMFACIFFYFIKHIELKKKKKKNQTMNCKSGFPTCIVVNLYVWMRKSVHKSHRPTASVYLCVLRVYLCIILARRRSNKALVVLLCFLSLWVLLEAVLALLN